MVLDKSLLVPFWCFSNFMTCWHVIVAANHRPQQTYLHHIRPLWTYFYCGLFTSPGSLSQDSTTLLVKLNFLSLLNLPLVSCAGPDFPASPKGLTAGGLAHQNPAPDRMKSIHSKALRVSRMSCWIMMSPDRTPRLHTEYRSGVGCWHRPDNPANPASPSCSTNTKQWAVIIWGGGGGGQYYGLFDRGGPKPISWLGPHKV